MYRFVINISEREQSRYTSKLSSLIISDTEVLVEDRLVQVHLKVFMINANADNLKSENVRQCRSPSDDNKGE